MKPGTYVVRQPDGHYAIYTKSEDEQGYALENASRTMIRQYLMAREIAAASRVLVGRAAQVAAVIDESIRNAEDGITHADCQRDLAEIAKTAAEDSEGEEAPTDE